MSVNSKNLLIFLNVSKCITLIKKYSLIVVVGPLGMQLLHVPTAIRLSLGSFISVSTSSTNVSLFFSFITLLEQHCRGVEFGFLEVVNIVGLGWRVSLLDQVLTFKLGFSHEITYKVPLQIEIRCTGKQQLTLFGLNRVEVSQMASNLTRLSLIDVYKGKGLYRASSPTLLLKNTK